MYKSYLTKQSYLNYIIESFAFLENEYHFKMLYIGDFKGVTTIISYLSKEIALEFSLDYGIELFLDIVKLIDDKLPPTTASTMKGKVIRVDIIDFLVDWYGLDRENIWEITDCQIQLNVNIERVFREVIDGYVRLIRVYIDRLLKNAVKVMDDMPPR